MNKYVVFFLASLVLGSGLVIHSAQGQTSCSTIADDAARKACIDAQWEARGLDARNTQRDTEILSRQLERRKEIDLRLEERYYTDIIRQIDAYSLDLYAIMLPMVRRMADVEFRARNLIYNRLPDLGIPLAPEAGKPLPEGISDFDVEEKFKNVQTCLDGGYYLDGGNPILQSQGPCLLYDVPASGVSPNPAGLSIIPGPGFFNFNGSWPDFSNRLAVIGGAPIFGVGGISLPPQWLPFLLPPFLSDGVIYRPPNLPDSDPFTRDDLTPLSVIPYYSPNAPQILTGYASQCLNNVPARYFPEYYPNAAGMTPEEIATIPLTELVNTPCTLNQILGNAFSSFLTGFLNNLFGTTIPNLDPRPFPSYETLAGNLAFYGSTPLLEDTQFENFTAGDFCAPLECTFPDEVPFNYVVDVEQNVFRSYVRDMRNSVEIVRQAYRALYYDLTQALAYWEYYERQQ